ncbi:MAG TPA: YbhB/YbcL family Raf kinase inhibitor-like protein [Pirellulales bacterium]|nr:YbhB/YbcL family Raf kinase inhibitor-like protein [Pirellulales bacterium]
MTIPLESSAFQAGAAIPDKYAEDGDDISPPLAWDNVPPGTKEFALICDDPDAPSKEPWVHWVLYKIPGEVRELPEGVPADERLGSPPGALQGVNSWPSGRTVGYRGPAPPSGTHHYHFRLYALDALLKLEAKANKAEVLKAMKGHVLAEGELMGTYKR